MVLFRLIHATGPSGAGTVTYTDTGGPTGQIPVAAKVVATVVTALDTNTTTSRISEGYFDGSNQRCCAVVMEHGANPSSTADSSVFAYTAKVLVIGDTNGGTTPALTGAAAGFGVNTLDITWDAALPNLNFDIILVYGSEVMARVTSLASSGSIGGTASTTGGPAKPNMVFAATTGTAFSSGGAAQGGGFGTGFAGRLPSTTQACAALHWNDQQITATAVGNINRNDAVCTYMTNDSTEGTRIEVSAWNSDGVTFTTRNAAVSIEFMVMELFFSDTLRVWAGAPLLPTSVAGAFSRTDPGFPPQALFFSHVRSGAINTVGNTQGSMGIGHAIGNGQGSSTVFSRDNQATSDAQSRHSQTFCAQIIQTAGAATMRFAWTSFDATGWSGSVTTASAADFNVPYVAIEDAVELISTETERLSETAVLVKTSDRIRQTEDERLSETAILIKTIDRIRQTENENISETHVFVLAGASIGPIVASETEQVSETALLYIGKFLISTETVNSSETAVLVLANAGALVGGETEQISDSAAFVLGHVRIIDETENVSENAVLVLRSASFPISETERISESAILILGRVLVVNDTVQISDADSSFGAGVIRQKATRRGKVF